MLAGGCGRTFSAHAARRGMTPQEVMIHEQVS